MTTLCGAEALGARRVGRAGEAAGAVRALTDADAPIPADRGRVGTRTGCRLGRDGLGRLGLVTTTLRGGDTFGVRRGGDLGAVARMTEGFTIGWILGPLGVNFTIG